MRRESGQATIEWVGLVLVAALVLGALAASRAPAADRELGGLLARRITCAAGAACPRGPAVRLPARASAGVAVPPVPRTKAVDAFRRLRGVGRLTNRIWIACLGYRRFVWERDHVLQPNGTMPLGEALAIADTCLNPLNFLGED